MTSPAPSTLAALRAPVAAPAVRASGLPELAPRTIVSSTGRSSSPSGSAPARRGSHRFQRGPLALGMLYLLLERRAAEQGHHLDDRQPAGRSILVCHQETLRGPQPGQVR